LATDRDAAATTQQIERIDAKHQADGTDHQQRGQAHAARTADLDRDAHAATAAETAGGALILDILAFPIVVAVSHVQTLVMSRRSPRTSASSTRRPPADKRPVV